MEKEIIKVPAGVRYISDWSMQEDGYGLDKEKFNRPHILDKSITGCGFTEYCIRNNLNIVLCSPRRILLENKEEQHPGEVYYACPKMQDKRVNIFDRDLNAKTSGKIGKELIIKQDGLLDKEYLSLCARKSKELRDEIRNYAIPRLIMGTPVKILVTYDSFRQVKEALGDDIQKFYVVIDEFQSIFVDARFKSSTEMEFVRELRGLSRVCYVSATPMLDQYLSLLDEFKNLPFFCLDWASEDPGRVISPRVNPYPVNRIKKVAEKIIASYRAGEFDKHIYKDDEGYMHTIESREAVFYVNSVRNICELIKKNKLTQEETNVLCAKTEENEEKIMKAFGVKKSQFQGIGRVPKKGEPHKMFTFCTRTVYLGADFYSTNAKSFVFSDSNIDCLSVDITMDLPQIVGRQRLDENPWKNEIDLYFKPTLDARKMTKSDFDIILNRKKSATENLLEIYNSLDLPELRSALVKKLRSAVIYDSYKNDYLSVDTHAGSNLVPVLNKLVMISDMRAFDIQQIDFKDRFAVFSIVANSSFLDMDKLGEAILVYQEFEGLSNFDDKLKLLCDSIENLPEDGADYLLKLVPPIFRDFYLVFGPEKCKSLKYRKKNLEEEYFKRYNNQLVDINACLSRYFEIGKTYNKKEVKSILSSVYKEVGLKRLAKAIDIVDYYNIQEISTVDPDTKKRVKVYKILSYV